jgi:hypothetical protein
MSREADSLVGQNIRLFLNRKIFEQIAAKHVSLIKLISVGSR